MADAGLPRGSDASRPRAGSKLTSASQIPSRVVTLQGMPAEGYGFGLAFAVNLGPGKSANVGSEGEYNWGGAAGTSFWIDPKEHMIGVFLVNVLPSSDVVAAGQFKRMAYEALVD